MHRGGARREPIMKTILYAILATLGASAAVLSGCWLAATLSMPAAPVVAALPHVPLTIHQPSDESGAVLLGSEAEEAMRRAVARYAGDVADAEIFLDGHQPPATFHHPDIGHMVQFSLALTLKNGTRLTTKPRHAKQALLAERVEEAVRRCMRRHAELVKQGLSPKGITNI